VNVRPLTPGDAPAIAALVRDDAELFYGHESRIQAEDVAEWTSRAKEAWVYEEDGRLLGVGWCTLWGKAGVIAGVAAAKGSGIGSDIVRRAEARLDGEPVAKLHGIAPEPDDTARRLFELNGYREVRRFYDMAIELTAEPQVAELAAPLVLEPFREGDAQAFHATTNEAFQDHWEWSGKPFDEWWKMREGQDHDGEGPLWFVVRDRDEMAAVVRNEANRNGGGYVGLIGVRRAWRGQGLAKALMYRTFAEFWRRGITRVTLGVDAESPTGATKLYERVGMHIESATVVFEKGVT
jgi:mycothiol synthase